MARAMTVVKQERVVREDVIRRAHKGRSEGIVLMPRIRGVCVGACDNAKTHLRDGRVTVLKGNLWAALPPDERFDLIVSNPPYIASASIPTLQREVQKEPKLALDGGETGLTLIARIVDGALERLKPGATLALEIGDEQGEAVAGLLTRAGYHDVRVDKDLARLDRLAFGHKGQ